ncbi:hypothetical protein MARHY3515 [Marinobacter nauticus ATCC 49840]|nr:hypothetical protein MARHY3515 [Marinobacter nauticus ATCC 49840]
MHLSEFATALSQSGNAFFISLV